jgi:hypothetical protein
MICATDGLCRRSAVDASTDGSLPDAQMVDGAMTDGALVDAAVDAAIDAGLDAGMRPCRLESERTRTTVTGSITADASWRCVQIYVLEGVVRVEALLEIEPGTRVVGERDAALVIEPSGRLHASGSAERPIVFGPETPAGRTPGGWGGIARLGSAPVNQSPAIDDATFTGAIGFGRDWTDWTTLP